MSEKRLEGRDRARVDLHRCAELLPTVSRTFALTIRVLPKPLRETVSVAYLLCRLADVIEDATGVDPAARVAVLERFADVLRAFRTGAEDCADGARSADARPRPAADWVAALSRALQPADRLPLADPDGARLLAEREVVLRAFCELHDAERRIVGRWVEDMARGMARFVSRELRQEPEVPHYRLETAQELREYAYYVAGTVGHLLTELFQLHIGAHRLDRERLRERAVPFGLGLQLTNILQDLAEDRTRGWSYVPEEVARRHGTTLSRLVSVADRPQAVRVVGELAREAVGYLDQAMEFTLLLPRSAPRVRLFCAWPIFFAIRTLHSICGDGRVLEGGEKIKISRREVRTLIGLTVASCLSDVSLRRLYRRERARLEERLLAWNAVPELPEART